MRSTFFGIEIGRTGVNMGQLGLDITGHNIANVNTKGFTRQRVVQTAHDPFGGIQMLKPVEQARVGGGVRVKIHDQIRSEFHDRRFRTENSQAAYWQMRTRELRSLESFFDNVDERTSINYSLNRFFSAMNVVSEDPVAGPPRREIKSAAESLVQQFNVIYTGLVDLQVLQNRMVRETVNEINDLSARLVELNEAIYIFEAAGQHRANDLRDQRNLLLDALSTIVDIEYEERTDPWGNSFLTVWVVDRTSAPVRDSAGATFGNDLPDAGNILVMHDRRRGMGVEAVEIPGNAGQTPPHPLETRYVPLWAPPAWVPVVGGGNVVLGTPEDPSGRLDDHALEMTEARGSLRSTMEMRDNDNVERPGIPYFIERLNELARALVQNVNEVHRQGWTEDHPPYGSQTNINFFYEPDDIDEITIRNIRLSDEILASEFNIAASSLEIRGLSNDPEDQQRGNNLNMRALYALFNSTNINFENGAGDTVRIGSFDDFATNVRISVASQTRASRNSELTATHLAHSAENQRLSISGVSLDEEMTHMIRFNHAFNGAARVITAMDELLERLINGTGRVGL
ncbi:MAG: hypothetical protein FWB97_02185 [Oscillospiraceae bacterium]|nr:hypothetical protein [Oscillospiraceae bacterium]